jgi:hypothetical protein
MRVGILVFVAGFWVAVLDTVLSLSIVSSGFRGRVGNLPKRKTGHSNDSKVLLAVWPR